MSIIYIDISNIPFPTLSIYFRHVLRIHDTSHTCNVSTATVCRCGTDDTDGSHATHKCVACMYTHRQEWCPAAHTCVDTRIHNRLICAKDAKLEFPCIYIQCNVTKKWKFIFCQFLVYAYTLYICLTLSTLHIYVHI